MAGEPMTVTQMQTIVATLGVFSYVFGAIAENMNPAAGTRVEGKDLTVICYYPRECYQAVASGYVSFAFLLASSVAGYISIFYPYKGKSIPRSVFFHGSCFRFFFYQTLVFVGLAALLLLWPTITEQLHLSRNVHHMFDSASKCPTVQPKLFGGGALFSLSSSIFWLVTLMLANNEQDYTLRKWN